MMSFGVRVDQVRRIFLLQGLLISLIGTALGLVLHDHIIVGNGRWLSFKKAGLL